MKTETCAQKDARIALALAKEAYGKDVVLETIEVDEYGRDSWGIDIEAAKKAVNRQF
jgi:hypothetical protein